jgi:hypothetical protein
MLRLVDPSLLQDSEANQRLSRPQRLIMSSLFSTSPSQIKVGDTIPVHDKREDSPEKTVHLDLKGKNLIVRFPCNLRHLPPYLPPGI